MNHKVILFSAPTDFIDESLLVPPSGYECEFLPIRSLKTLQTLNDKERYSYWVTNPCPEFQISREVVSMFPNLEIIATPSTGKSHIDQKACDELGVRVVGLLDTDLVKEISASSEFTFLLCLASIRNLRSAMEEVANGNWRNVETNLRSREIKELSVGIIGLGRIGTNLTKYFNAMGATTLGYDPFLPTDVVPPCVKVCSSLEEILPMADVIIISVVLNSQTKSMVNSAFIENMKTGAVLINTSRGDVIEENAVVDGLKSKKIRACAVDVLSKENEPNFLQGSPLFRYSMENHNVIITPHIAGLTTDSETKAQVAALKLITG